MGKAKGKQADVEAGEAVDSGEDGMESGDDLEPAAVQAPPTAAEKKAAEARWQEKVDQFKIGDRAALQGVLMLHWEKGKFVQELRKDGEDQGRHYGNHTVEQFAKELGVVTELAYAYDRFAAGYDKEEVEQAAAQRVAWHNIFYLLSVGDKAARLKLQTKVARRELTTEQLREAVKVHNRGTHVKKARAAKDAGQAEPKRRGGADSPVRVFKTFQNVCVGVTEKIDGFLEAARELRKTPPEERKTDTVQRYKEMWKEAERLLKKLSGALEKAKIDG
jgi:hypothetical protein